jgi:hypothetical protein
MQHFKRGFRFEEERADLRLGVLWTTITFVLQRQSLYSNQALLTINSVSIWKM